MAFDLHKNFAYSTVATAPSPALSGTSLVVQAGDGAKFPTAPFNATVWPAGVLPTTANAEIVRVTAITTDTFTITRSQEGSSARSIGVGDQIAAIVSAKTLTDIENLLNGTVTGAILDTPTIRNFDSWEDANETWTYGSATTFTISGDKTGKYQKGDKIKLTQTTVKYFYIIAISYAAGTTTVTITGGSDYSLANAAITANFYSKEDNPQGFPDWFNFTSTATGTGGTAGAYTEDTLHSRFRISGRTCTVLVTKHITNLGSWTGTVQISMPIASVNTEEVEFMGGVIIAQTGITFRAVGQGIAAGATVFTFNNSVGVSLCTWANLVVNDWVSIKHHYQI